jgi:Sulfotransferase family
MPAEMSPVLTSQVQPPSSIARDRAPVFVLGCGRSGTKFLYHTLLSAGGFAVYYAESNAFNLLGSRFGNLRHRKNRQKMLDTWFSSKLFQRTGLTPEEIEPRILNECNSAADFLRIVMETIAHKQGVHRWAECTPLHLLYLPLIKSLIPEALIVHIIRDGRDVAVSLNKIGWIRPYPWDRTRSVITAGIFWRWIVSKGLVYGRSMGTDYTELHYEDLVAQPQQTLARLGEFLQHDLDYDRIQQAGLGSLQNPNSSFKDDRATTDFSPVGRWKTVLSPEQVKDLETAIGDLLTNLDYSLETPREKLTKLPAVQLMTLLYPTVFDVKLWLKNHTPLARTADIGRMGLLKPTETS